MRLTLVNFFKGQYRGNMFSGKRKVPNKIRYWMRRDLIEDIQREEQNMLWLRHHYLSKEQVKGYRYDLQKNEEFFKKVIDAKKSNFPKHVTVETHLGYLRHLDSWENFK